MKTYFVTRVRETETDWILDVQDMEPIQANDLKEAKAMVVDIYGGFRNFKRRTQKHHPEIAGEFYI